MRVRYLIPLLGLRRRLFWAQARSRNEKVFTAAGLGVVCLFAALLGLMGTRFGPVALHLGRVAPIANLAFGLIFLATLSLAPLIGLESNRIFSEERLRRYPLTHFERVVAYYAVGLLDSTWLFLFALDVGVAAGFAAIGASPWWLAVPAAILLFATSYLAARLLESAMDRFLAARSAPILVILAVVLAIPLVVILGPALRAHGAALEADSLAFLRLTPPLAAAALMTRAASPASVGWMMLLFAWLFGFGFVLFTLERKPRRPARLRGSSTAEATWDGFYDRVAAAFGRKLAPLMGKTLRYYLRSPQLRSAYAILVFIPLVLAFVFARGKSDPLAGFLVVLATVCFVGYGGAGNMIANAFGFDRSGFRRYFLSPVPSTTVLRAAALVPLLLGAVAIPISLGIWLIFWHGHFDARMLVMLFSVGFAGMLLFQALGLWTSLIWPSAADLDRPYGNKVPLPQKVLTIGGMFFPLILVSPLAAIGSASVLEYWWVTPPILILAVACYLYTLRMSPRLFRSRRERMLSTIEREN